MYIVMSPDSTFNGDFSGYKFKSGNCITKLDDNLKLWFKMLGFKVESYKEPEKKTKEVIEKKEAEEIEEEK